MRGDLHKKCKEMSAKFQTNTAPTRLLYIPRGSPARLCETPQGEYPAYVALSYCWGKNEHQKNSQTMNANFEDRLREIDSFRLPQTIVDAIEVTQSLSLSYLWVDALCIIQDNQQDRQKEIDNMANIYRGATITIVAACAAESTEGFLGDRKLAEVYGHWFRLPYRHTRKNDNGYVLLSANPNYDTFRDPIDKRAWTMQEEILSLRLLRFGSKQTVWRCLEGWQFDGGDCPQSEYADRSYNVTSPYEVQRVQSMLASEGNKGAWDAATSWQKTIENYTRRELTNAADRLPACAAMAQIYSEIRGFEASDYLAGLWKSDIASELLWYRLEEHRPKERKDTNNSGPTWSWASLNMPIEFFSRYLLQDYAAHAKVELVDSDMIYESENHKYSGVKSGCLRLNGVMKQASWDGCCLRQRNDCGEILPGTIHWDLPMEFIPRNVWCFEISSSKFSLSLVLDSDFNELEFRRVGLFECWNKGELKNAWFNEAERQVITIY